MFTGFASENTPAIQVWDFFQPNASFSNVRSSVSLTDDCAPIQYFRTGGDTNPVRVYLPTAPPEGKVIRFIVARYGPNSQGINLFSSDARDGTGAQFASGIYYGTPGRILELVYSKNVVSVGVAGSAETGWLSLTESPVSSPAYRAVALSSSSATANHAISAGANATASGANSVCLGGQNATASGAGAVCIGNGTSSGSNASVIGATSSSASNTQSIVIGGESNTSQGFRSSVIGGQSNNTSATNAITLGCNNAIANSSNSSVLGGSYGSTRSITAYTVFPGTATIAASVGVTQTALSVLGKETTDATPGRLTSNGSASGGTTNQVILPNNSAYTFQGTCIAARTAAGDTSSWKFEGAIKRGANAASTTLVAAVTPTVIAQDAGAATWVLAITADTTNGGIAVTVTGAAATTIRWVCKIETTEVTF